MIPGGRHDERERPVDALILRPVAGVGARQGAERHCARHETEIGVRFAGADKLVHLSGKGEASLCRLGWGFAERLDRAGQIGDDFSNRNQLAALTLHALFSHARQTRQGNANRRFNYPSVL